jgi:PHD/YefM family antitoxin component YafN of YafNO toxin-antitoxin module
MRETQTLASTGHRHRYLTNEKGEREAIILSIDEYEELLEDIEDLAVVLERRGEPTIPFEEVKKRLKEDGLI